MTLLSDDRLGSEDLARDFSAFADERFDPNEPAAPSRSSAGGAALLIITLASLATMHRCFEGWGSDWVGPVFITAIGVHVVCRFTQRHVEGPVVGGLIDIVAFLLLGIWTVVPASTNRGVPTWRTWHAISGAFVNISNRFAAASLPVQPKTAFLLLGVGGAGVVALAGSWLVLRFGRNLLAILPGFVCFVVCASIGTRTGRGWTTALEVAAISGYLLVERWTAPGPPGVLLGYRPAVAGPGEMVGGVAIAALAVLMAAVTAPALTGPNGHGPLGWNVLDPSSTRIVISPLVDLKTRLLQDGDRPVFTVESTQPSYWRLTSLDDFNGSQWNADDTYQSVDHKLSGVMKPAGTRQVTENFDIEELDSPWAPLAFDPEAISGAGRVSYDPRSGSLLTPHNTSNGLQYTVTSVEYLADLSAGKLSAAPSLAHASIPSHSLQLPGSIPSRVRRLARQLVAGKQTEYAQAYALQAYFHTSEFSYTLDPPSDGTNTTALENFLFATHAGYCQQFAGAFAVLARLDGLPTRLAVGFTTGKPIGDSTYQVTDADAHTWPEVWFPTYGWVPFEPTQGTTGHGFAIPGAAGYTGNTTTQVQVGPSTTQPVTPLPASTSTVPTSASSSPPLGHVQNPRPAQLPHGLGSEGGASSAPATSHRARAASGSDQSRWIILEAALGLVAAVVVLGSANRFGRRRRWRARRSRAPADPSAYGAAMTLAAWAEVQETLAWHGMRRHRSETLTEMAGRVSGRDEFDRRGPGRGGPADHLRRLAELATLAAYTGAVSADQRAQAEKAAVEVRRSLRLYTTLVQRVRLMLDPRLSWFGPVASSEPATGSSRRARANPWVYPS